jgi:hypothetical protein
MKITCVLRAKQYAVKWRCWGLHSIFKFEKYFILCFTGFTMIKILFYNILFTIIMKVTIDFVHGRSNFFSVEVLDELGVFIDKKVNLDKKKIFSVGPPRAAYFFFLST